MRAGFLPARVVHLHLTRRCNLACSHCYSASSPGERDWLPGVAFVRALEALRGEGYDTLSLSGGEPLLYRDLDEVLSGATKLGYRINLITNGTVLTSARLDLIAGRVSLAAVSFDGPPEIHNRMRGRNDAYDRAVVALDDLHGAGIPTGIAYCVGRDSLPGVLDAHALATEKGARLLHLHPLVAIGRAATDCAEQALDELDQARLYLAAGLLDGAPDGPRIQCDLLPVSALDQARGQFQLLDPEADEKPLAELINPLILTETGQALPCAYGMDAAYALGAAADDLASSIKKRRKEVLPLLRELVQQTFADIEASGASFVEWYGRLAAAGHNRSLLASRP